MYIRNEGARVLLYCVDHYLHWSTRCIRCVLSLTISTRAPLFDGIEASRDERATTGASYAYCSKLIVKFLLHESIKERTLVHSEAWK